MIKIASGEYCDYLYIEIEKIPDISILLEQSNTNTDVSAYIERIKIGIVLFRRVLRSLIPDIKSILNSKIELTKGLFFCVKVHLIRQVKYHTSIKVDKDLIEEALSNAKKA